MAIVRIRDGALPCLDQPQMYAGFGQKNTCSLCQAPITSQQTEYEVPQEDGAALFFHVECYDAWIHACHDSHGVDAR